MKNQSEVLASPVMELAGGHRHVISMSDAERFWVKVEQSDDGDCWIRQRIARLAKRDDREGGL